MSVRANIAIFGSDAKWRAIKFTQALNRSFLMHAGVGLILVMLSLLATMPRHHDMNYVNIEFLPDGRQTSQTPAVPLVGDRQQKALPRAHLRTASAWRDPPVIAAVQAISTVKATLPSGQQAQLRANPVVTISAAASETKFQDDQIGSAPSVEARFYYPPVPANHSHLSSTEELRLINNGGAWGPTNIDDPIFCQLDAEACRLFNQAECTSAKSDSDVLCLRAIALMDSAVPALKPGQDSSMIAVAWRNVGRCYDRLNDLPAAELCFKQSVEMYKTESERDSLERAVSLVYYGDVLSKEQRYDEAEQAFKDSIPGYVSEFGSRSLEVSWTYERLADIYSVTQRCREAAAADLIASKCREEVPKRANFMLNLY